MCHRKEGVESKKWFLSHKFFYVPFSVTQSLFLLAFSWVPDNFRASNKKSTSKKKPTSVFEIIFAQRYYNSATFSIWVVYTTCVSKNSIVSQKVIFYNLWYTW